MAWPASGRVCKLSINHSLVSGSLSQFPVLITAAMLPAEAITSGGSHAMRSDGGDVRFALDALGNSPLHSGVKSISLNANPSLSSFYCHTGVTAVDGTSNGDIYVYYGNSSVTTPAASDASWGRNGIWGGNYLGAWPLGNGSSIDLTDWTGNANTLFQNGAVNSVAGLIDGGIQPDSASFLSASDAGGGFDISTFSMSGWIKITGSSGTYSNAMFGQRGGSTGQYCRLLALLSNNYGAFQIYNGTSIYSFGGTWSFNTWYYIVVSVSGGSVTCYQNGTSLGTQSIAVGSSTNVPFLIGNDGNFNNEYFNGIITECRFPNVAITNSWQATEYANQSASGQTNFYSAGTPRSYSPGFLNQFGNFNSLMTGNFVNG